MMAAYTTRAGLPPRRGAMLTPRSSWVPCAPSTSAVDKARLAGDFDADYSGLRVVGVEANGDVVRAGFDDPGAVDPDREPVDGERELHRSSAVRRDIDASEGREAPERALDAGAAGTGVHLDNFGCV